MRKIEITGCPNCGSNDLSIIQPPGDYFCKVCGRMKYEQVQRIARERVRKFWLAVDNEHYGYFYHVLNSFGG